jgi:ribosome-associated protein
VTDSKPSKSARKREQLALQDLGEQLIGLTEAERASFSFDERLDAAIRDARKIKTHGALRRQKQLIGKLMRNVDAAPIRAQLARLRADETHSKYQFATAEKWRDRIISEGSTALDDFAADTGADDKELRSLLAALQAAVSEKAEKTARRNIFRRVHQILVKIPR